MEPNNVDIAMGMLEREVAGIANILATKLGYPDSTLVRVAMEYGKMKFGNEIRAIVASTIESDASMSAGASIAKEAFGGYVDDFKKRLKQEMEGQGK